MKANDEKPPGVLPGLIAFALMIVFTAAIVWVGLLLSGTNWSPVELMREEKYEQ